MSSRELLKYRVVVVVLVHALLVSAAWFGSWYLRLERDFVQKALAGGTDYMGRCGQLFPWILLIRLLALGYFGLFQGLWRYVSLTDLVNLFKATATGTLAYVLILAALRFEAVPLSIPLIESLLTLVLLGGIRFAIRVWRERFAPAAKGTRRVLIAGAGDAGEMLLRAMRSQPHLGYDPVGFVDDDPHKLAMKIHGLPVLGSIADLREVVQSTAAEEVIVAAPSATGDFYRRVLDQCTGTGTRIRRLPTSQSEVVRLTGLRDVDFADLLDREPVRVDLDALTREVRGRAIIVTGAGGSIGSEVVRQLAPLQPGIVVALDRSENALFYLEREMAVRHPLVPLRVRVGDCQDTAAMRALFAEIRPGLVIHAAAYKHVPLMEAHPVEAVRNNVAASLALARLAREHGVPKFLLISSDKAVNPTSMMGATKRAAELALQSLPPAPTQFVAVRFGNVLGSEGSVVPLFRRQIAEGGPVTVTHPDVVRYFMTIEEAVGLVLQAGVMGRGGELFHLDMGRPVKVSELAEKLIQLSGFRPHEDIEIRYTGLRPGEKMHEELLAAGEGVEATGHPRIFVVRRGDPDRERLAARIEDLLSAASLGRDPRVRALKTLVPEYEPNNDEFRRAIAESAAPLESPRPRD
jgi:FlaA1/EpsC-like NDP-sugar epimerase